jgi:hypothetical protein
LPTGRTRMWGSTSESKTRSTVLGRDTRGHRRQAGGGVRRGSGALPSKPCAWHILRRHRYRVAHPEEDVRACAATIAASRMMANRCTLMTPASVCSATMLSQVIRPNCP